MLKKTAKTANDGLVLVALGMAAYGLYQFVTDLAKAADDKLVEKLTETNEN